MDRRRSTKNLHNDVKIVSGWQTVLSDVNAEIEKTRERLGHLEQSERIIREKIAAGEPFPAAGSFSP